MIIIANAFSIAMLPQWRRDPANPVTTELRIEPLTLDKVREIITIGDSYGRAVHSAVGHADTARVFSQLLCREVPVNRVSATIDGDTTLIVGQYSGPRLPEGATELPEGAAITWFVVEMV